MMTKENFLPAALFISLTIHTAVIFSNYLMRSPQKQNTTRGGIEITYRQDAGKKDIDVREHPIKPSQRLDLKNTSMMPTDGSIPLKLGTEGQGLASSFMINERKPEKIRSEMTHHVTIVPSKSEKINNPAYAAYNEMVRNSIREKVYENYRNHGLEAGTVYLTFVIGKDGSLRAAQIIDEKTNASTELKNISFKSLKESRFPPFYNGMTLPEYTFNIEIQYKLRE